MGNFRTILKGRDQPELFDGMTELSQSDLGMEFDPTRTELLIEPTIFMHIRYEQRHGPPIKIQYVIQPDIILFDKAKNVIHVVDIKTAKTFGRDLSSRLQVLLYMTGSLAYLKRLKSRTRKPNTREFLALSEDSSAFKRLNGSNIISPVPEAADRYFSRRYGRDYNPQPIQQPETPGVRFWYRTPNLAPEGNRFDYQEVRFSPQEQTELAKQLRATACAIHNNKAQIALERALLAKDILPSVTVQTEGQTPSL